MSEFGLEIKELRKAAKISQKQLAEFLEVDQSYISKIEKNERSMNYDLLEKTAELFGVDVSCFLEESVDFEPLRIGFRTNGIVTEDLHAIRVINKLVFNLRFIDSIESGE